MKQLIVVSLFFIVATFLWLGYEIFMTLGRAG